MYHFSPWLTRKYVTIFLSYFLRFLQNINDFVNKLVMNQAISSRVGN